MTKKQLLYVYSIIGLLLFVFDRITKHWAIAHCADGWQINNVLSCDLAYNRGVSWNLFASSDVTGRTILYLFIALIIGVVAVHTWSALRRNRTIWGELLVLAGASSNLLDRVLYDGVVDFIHFRYGEYSWPIFNGADIFIVVGVGIIFITNYWDD